MIARFKKNIGKLVSVVLILAMAFQSFAAPLSSMNPAAASEPAKITGTWSMDASGSWHFNAQDGAAKDGWYYLNTTNDATDYNWFCFDANGVMRTGWVPDKNDPSVWYYTGETKDSSEGGLVKGWITDPQDGQRYYLDPSTGIMCHGWKQIDGVWYYFTESRYADRKWAPDTKGYWMDKATGRHSHGSLYVNERTPDGYYVGITGAWLVNGGSSSGGNYTPPAPPAEPSAAVDVEKVTVNDNGKLQTGEGDVSITSGGDEKTPLELPKEKAVQLAEKINTMLDSAPVAQFTGSGLKESSKIDTTEGLQAIIKELQARTGDETAKNSIGSKTASDIDLQIKIVLSDVNINASDDLTVTSMEFEVTPIASTTVKDSNGDTITVSTEIKKELSEKVKFRLPIDSSLAADGNKIAVYHEGEFFGNYEIQGVTPNTYIEIESRNFSKFGYSVLNANNAAAKIGDTLYFKFADAVESVGNEETITLLKPAVGEVTINREVTFTVDKNGRNFNATVKAAAGYNIRQQDVSESSIVFTCKKQVAVTFDENPFDPGNIKARQTLTIKGKNLDLVTKVVFCDNVEVTNFKSQSSEQIVIENFPVKARTGKVTLVSGTTSQEVTSDMDLVVAQPSVSEIYQFTGVKPNQKLTIEGKNFDLVYDAIIGDDTCLDYTVKNVGNTIEITMPDEVHDGTVKVIAYSGVEVTVATVTTSTPATTYTVTFNLNGATGTAPTSQSIASGSKATKPDDPIFTDHTFAGWYKTKNEDGTLSDKWDFNKDTVSENITLYANWTTFISRIVGTNDNIPTWSAGEEFNWEHPDLQNIPNDAWVAAGGQKAFWVPGEEGGFAMLYINKISDDETKILVFGTDDTDVFIKVGDKYICTNDFGTFTCTTNAGVFTSLAFEGNDLTEYEMPDFSLLNGTYTAPETKKLSEILPAGFPSSADSAWVNEGGQKAYKNGDNIKVGNLTLGKDTTVTKSGDNYVCKSGDATVTFNVKDGAAESITVTGSTGSDGTYTPAPTISTIADVLATAGDNAPSATSHWYDTKGNYIYANDEYLSVHISAIGDAQVKLDRTVTPNGDNYLYSEGVLSFTFNMTEGVLTSIHVNASAYGVNDTFSPAPATTFKAVYDTTEDVNTLTFYYDAVDHSGEGTVYENGTANYLFDDSKNNGAKWGYNGNRSSIKSVVIDSSVANYDGLTSTAYMFQSMTTATNISGAEYLDVSNVTDMSYMFNNFGGGASGSPTTLNVVPDVSKWNTGNVTNMTGMFALYGYNSSMLDKVPNVSGWNTGNVTNMQQMFQKYGHESQNFNAVPDVSKWNTGNVTNMVNVFFEYGHKSTSLGTVPDVSGWNTGKVENMQQMFYEYGNASTNISCVLDLSGWDLSEITETHGVNVFKFNPKTFSVTIPAKTGEKSNEGEKWYYGDGTNTIAPPEGETFTLPAPTEYTVTFDLNGITITGTAPEAQKIEENSKVTKPADPTDSVHTFAGWYKTKDATTGVLSDPWNFDTDTVTADITLYAQWTRTMGSIMETNENMPLATDYPNAPANAWVNADTGKVAYKTTDGAFMIVNNPASGAAGMGVFYNDELVKVGNTYVGDWTAVGYGVLTCIISDGVFTSALYEEGTRSDVKGFTGTYAPAAVTPKYMDWDAGKKELVEKPIPAEAIEVTNATTTLDAGEFYVVKGADVQTGTITVNGTTQSPTTLILMDGAKLTATGGGNYKAGINVATDRALVITGQSGCTGKLIATGGYNGAGIGGGANAGQDSGNITINGGDITATGGEDSAGIGGGLGSGGNTTINGGKVNATGGVAGAGIGGGSMNGGIVTINGGDVTATGGGDYGTPGIGGYCDGADVTINGGRVTAIATEDAEAIGRGAGGASSGTVTFGEGVNFTINAGADKDNTESKTTAQYSEDHSAAYVSIEEAVKPEIKTVAEVLATVDGGFPISKETGWVTEQGNKSFIRVVSGEKNICFAKGSKSNAIKVTSKVAKSGENYTCGTGILFTMNNGKLVSITRQEGDDYDGTYIPASDSEQLLKASGAAGGSGDAATEASVPEAAEKAPLTEPFAPAVEPEKFEAEKSEDQLQPAEAVAVEGVEAVE